VRLLVATAWKNNVWRPVERVAADDGAATASVAASVEARMTVSLRDRMVPRR
jgi:hypothetical protein